MSNDAHWDRVREIARRGQRSTGHFAIAAVDPDGRPTITPIGTIFLRADRTAFYFDQYTDALARNLDADPRVCVMAVDSDTSFWFRSLLTGRFSAPPGVRMYGTAGPRRPATETELAQVDRRCARCES